MKFSYVFPRLLLIGAKVGLYSTIVGSVIAAGFSVSPSFLMNDEVLNGDHPAGAAALRLAELISQDVLMKESTNQSIFTVCAVIIGVSDKIICTFFAYLFVSKLFLCGRIDNSSLKKEWINPFPSREIFSFLLIVTIVTLPPSQELIRELYSIEQDTMIISLSKLPAFLIMIFLPVSLVYSISRKTWANSYRLLHKKIYFEDRNGQKHAPFFRNCHPDTPTVYEEVVKLLIVWHVFLYIILTDLPKSSRSEEFISIIFDSSIGVFSILILLRYIPVLIARFFTGYVPPSE
ncbi:MAG: hypothetical protein AAFS07_16270 [Pseudomonadota bacterium]